MNTNWWSSPRRICVVVDNDSWILPFAEQLVKAAQANGDEAVLARSHDDIPVGEIGFYLGCVKITPPEVLARNKKNLVIHASELPKGRGFSPLTWQIIDGINTIPVCLLEADERVDEGAIVYREYIKFDGSEVLGELHTKLGAMHVSLAGRYLAAPTLPTGHDQVGEATYHERRRPDDSRLAPDKSIAEQFDLLRTVHNDKYPAFFDFRGCRYVLKIEKISTEDQS